MADYLKHHGFKKGPPEQSRTSGPACEVCGRPMLAGQRRRHGVCSPPLECCGPHTDLVPDLKKHRDDHFDHELGRDRRFDQRDDYDPGPRR